jgi:hypothetical protein
VGLVVGWFLVYLTAQLTDYYRPTSVGQLLVHLIGAGFFMALGWSLYAGWHPVVQYPCPAPWSHV